MNERPTPETDAAWEDALRLPTGGFSANPNTMGLAIEMSRFARRLERQRDGLLEVMERIVVGYEKHVSILPSDLASAKAAISAAKKEKP